MSIVRTIEWKLRCDPEEADALIRAAFTKLDLDPSGPMGQIHGAAKRAVMKNRWSAEIDVEVLRQFDGAAAVCRVQMPAGTKHYEVAADIADALGDKVLDDRGLTAAVERLGKAGRLFGRKEVRHLVNLLRHSERVYELGQGQYSGKMGLIVLTDQRLFFLEKSLGSETLEEFPLASISSMSIGKKLGGETLQIHASGHQGEIKSMGHGQADALARAFRNLKTAASRAPGATASAQAQAADDPITQLERLAGLRDKGILTGDEYNAKKAEIIARM